MKKPLLLLYTLYAGIVFVLIYLLIFPVQFVLLQKNNWKPYAHACNRVWGKVFLFLIGMPLRVRYDFEPKPRGAYVFAPNHFSYMDVATMGVIIDNYFAFVGKSEAKYIPALGYMFAKLHIQVDRAEPESRSKTVQKSLKTLQNGRSIMIFPEGGIKTTNAPQMYSNIKDGAFLMAITQQVPLVPITLLSNHKRIPDRRPYRLVPGAIEAIVHAPIPTAGMTTGDVEMLKNQWINLMQGALNEAKV